MSNTLTGAIHHIGETEFVGANDMPKRIIVIETEGEYPQLVKFEAIKDHTKTIDDLVEGQTVEISYNIRGREWNGKYYTDLQLWRINVVE